MMLKAAAHAGLFLAAVVMAYLGLGVGLHGRPRVRGRGGERP